MNASIDFVGTELNSLLISQTLRLNLLETNFIRAENDNFTIVFLQLKPEISQWQHCSRTWSLIKTINNKGFLINKCWLEIVTLN